MLVLMLMFSLSCTVCYLLLIVHVAVDAVAAVIVAVVAMLVSSVPSSSGASCSPIAVSNLREGLMKRTNSWIVPSDDESPCCVPRVLEFRPAKRWAVESEVEGELASPDSAPPQCAVARSWVVEEESCAAGNEELKVPVQTQPTNVDVNNLMLRSHEQANPKDNKYTKHAKDPQRVKKLMSEGRPDLVVTSNGAMLRLCN